MTAPAPSPSYSRPRGRSFDDASVVADLTGAPAPRTAAGTVDAVPLQEIRTTGRSRAQRSTFVRGPREIVFYAATGSLALMGAGGLVAFFVSM